MTDPLLSQVRLLIFDTDPAQPIFQDDEINQFIYLTSSQALYTSGQFFPTAAQTQVPPQVYSIYRAAALGLRSMASNGAALSVISKILDVTLDASKGSAALRAMAKDYIDMEANSGQFAIAEMVQDQFSARERTVKMFQRLYGGS